MGAQEWFHLLLPTNGTLLGPGHPRSSKARGVREGLVSGTNSCGVWWNESCFVASTNKFLEVASWCHANLKESRHSESVFREEIIKHMTMAPNCKRLPTPPPLGSIMQDPVSLPFIHEVTLSETAVPDQPRIMTTSGISTVAASTGRPNSIRAKRVAQCFREEWEGQTGCMAGKEEHMMSEGFLLCNDAASLGNQGVGILCYFESA